MGWICCYWNWEGKKVKTKRPYVHHASEFSLEIESKEDGEVYDLKPAAVTQQEESELKEDSEDNEDSHDVDFVSF